MANAPPPIIWDGPWKVNDYSESPEIPMESKSAINNPFLPFIMTDALQHGTSCTFVCMNVASRFLRGDEQSNMFRLAIDDLGTVYIQYAPDLKRTVSDACVYYKKVRPKGGIASPDECGQLADNLRGYDTDFKMGLLDFWDVDIGRVIAPKDQEHASLITSYRPILLAMEELYAETQRRNKRAAILFTDGSHTIMLFFTPFVFMGEDGNYHGHIQVWIFDSLDGRLQCLKGIKTAVYAMLKQRHILDGLSADVGKKRASEISQATPAESREIIRRLAPTNWTPNSKQYTLNIWWAK